MVLALLDGWCKLWRSFLLSVRGRCRAVGSAGTHRGSDGEIFHDDPGEACHD